MKYPVATAILIAAVFFIFGYILGGNLASRPMTFYVSVPGEYSVLATGGNHIQASRVGPLLDTTECQFFGDRETYDEVVTMDVLMGRESLYPECFATFSD